MIHRTARLLLLFLIVLSTAIPAWSQQIEPLAVDGLWQTLDAKDATPDTLPATSTWQTVDLTNAETQPTSWTESSTLWLSKEVQIPPEWDDRPLALGIVVRGDTQVYAGDQLLTVQGTEITHVRPGHWFFDLPRVGTEPLVLVIRNAVNPSTVVYARNRIGFESISIGPSDSLATIERSKRQANALRTSIFPLVVSVLLLAGAVASFVLFAMLRMTPFLWFGLASSTSVSWFAVLLWDQFAILPIDGVLSASLALGHLAFALSLKYYWGLLRSGPMPLYWRISLGAALFCALAFAVNLDWALAWMGPPIHELVALNCTLVGMALVLLESWRGNRTARIMAVAVAPQGVMLAFQLVGQAGVGPGVPEWAVGIGNLAVLFLVALALLDVARRRLNLDALADEAASTSGVLEALEIPSVPSSTTAQLLAQSTIGLTGSGDFDAIALPQARLDPQSRIGRYVLHECLGQGGMGEVYRARDPDLDRNVAIKLVKSTEGDGGARRQAMLLREAVAMARCVHPNVVTIFDVGTHETDVFLAMEYLRGTTLTEWQDGAPGPAVVQRYRQAGQGLAAAHRAGVIHGDFKPANVMCTEDGRTVVVDFGIAGAKEGTEAEAALNRSLGVHLHGAGTPAYMAPELHKGAPSSPQSDQYALAISLLNALYGWPLAPSPNGAHGVQHRIERGDLSPKRDWIPPKPLLETLFRALENRPEDRFDTMDDMIRGLRTEPA